MHSLLRELGSCAAVIHFVKRSYQHSFNSDISNNMDPARQSNDTTDKHELASSEAAERTQATTIQEAESNVEGAACCEKSPSESVPSSPQPATLDVETLKQLLFSTEERCKKALADKDAEVQRILWAALLLQTILRSPRVRLLCVELVLKVVISAHSVSKCVLKLAMQPVFLATR